MIATDHLLVNSIVGAIVWLVAVILIVMAGR